MTGAIITIVVLIVICAVGGWTKDQQRRDKDFFENQ